MVVRYYYTPANPPPAPKQRKPFADLRGLPAKRVRLPEEDVDDEIAIPKRKVAHLGSYTPPVVVYLPVQRKRREEEEEEEEVLALRRRSVITAERRSWRFKKSPQVVEDVVDELAPVRRTAPPRLLFIPRVRRLTDVIDDVEDLLQRKPRTFFGQAPIITFVGGSITFEFATRTFLFEMPRRSFGVEPVSSQNPELPKR